MIYGIKPKALGTITKNRITKTGNISMPVKPVDSEEYNITADGKAAVRDMWQPGSVRTKDTEELVEYVQN